MQTQSVSQSAPLPEQMAPLRALLLDDNRFDRKRIRRLADQANLNIDLVEVDTLTRMKSAVDEAQYDLFLIDYRLPVGDGLEALQMLRADPRHDAAGNILITGSPELSTTVRAMQTGYHDVLSKEDITAEHLKTAIQSAVSQASGSAPGLMSPQQFVTGMREAMSHPDMHTKLGQILTDHLAADQDRLDPGYEPLLQSFLEEDEFIFDMRRSK